MHPFLAAREARQRRLDEALNEALMQAAAQGCPSVILASTNIPGPWKARPGLSKLLDGAWAELAAAAPLNFQQRGQDRLGPWRLAASPLEPRRLKVLALGLEEAHPARRLLDLDVHTAAGACSRAELGLPPRSCLCCGEDARDCIRVQRHGESEFEARLEDLLAPFAPPLPDIEPGRLAEALVLGAQRELDLSPKPGLVDRFDNGAHPDLSHGKMQASIRLLPRYYAELLEAAERGDSLETCAALGRAAEARMFDAIGSNAHRGYLFLSGLLLLACHRVQGRAAALPRAVSDLAFRFFGERIPANTHGAALRAQGGPEGIRAEAESGLPSVFDGALPLLLRAHEDAEQAGFRALAELMQRVEDSTTLHRCGPDGLARIRRDGARLEACLQSGAPPEPLLAALNEDYRRSGLTMGGVADCLALAFALHSA